MSNIKFALANIGSIVRIKIPDVGGGRGSIIAVVLKLKLDGFYLLGHSNGIINLKNTINL